MADTTDIQTFHSGSRKLVIKFSAFSDGTGEIDAIKVDKSALTGPNGIEPSKLVIEEIEWNVQGYNYVLLEWDRTTDQEIAILGKSSGYKDYRPYGGLPDNASGGTGDIILTTSGAAAGASYDISMVLRLKA